jgi:exosortase family protein XrtF
MGFDFIRENRKAIWFLLVFAGLYLILNTTYGVFIQHYYPTSDPFTSWVTKQVVWCSSWFDSSIGYRISLFTNKVEVFNEKGTVIYVFEGCNGLNVMIVYTVFLLAFRGSAGATMKIVGIGIAAIHLFNLLRIILLYVVAVYFRPQLYFFHKYLFTGIIYLFVFALWYLWVRKVKNE